MSEVEEVEQLAREFHEVYQREAKRQGDVRHHDDYDALSENVKEFDRALARHVIGQRQADKREIDAVNAMLYECSEERTTLRAVLADTEARLEQQERERERLEGLLRAKNPYDLSLREYTELIKKERGE
jgi:hypothetical protein